MKRHPSDRHCNTHTVPASPNEIYLNKQKKNKKK